MIHIYTAGPDPWHQHVGNSSPARFRCVGGRGGRGGRGGEGRGGRGGEGGEGREGRGTGLSVQVLEHCSTLSTLNISEVMF